MKILIRIMQWTGFVLIALGMLACDSSIPKGAVLIAAGAIIMYGFARMEKNYYFADGLPERRMSHVNSRRSI